MTYDASRYAFANRSIIYSRGVLGSLIHPEVVRVDRSVGLQ